MYLNGISSMMHKIVYNFTIFFLVFLDITCNLLYDRCDLDLKDVDFSAFLLNTPDILIE